MLTTSDWRINRRRIRLFAEMQTKPCTSNAEMLCRLTECSRARQTENTQWRLVVKPSTFQRTTISFCGFILVSLTLSAYHFFWQTSSYVTIKSMHQIMSYSHIDDCVNAMRDLDIAAAKFSRHELDYSRAPSGRFSIEEPEYSNDLTAIGLVNECWHYVL